MSEPIIIEIPSPTCRARFVLVHVGQCSGATCGIPRDATPDDLARGGYVPSVGYLPRREVETAVSDAMDLQRRLDRMTEVAEQNRERFETAETELSADTIRADAWKAKAIKAEADLGVAESANEEAGELLAAETARAENAEGLLIQRETELRLAREDGAAVERQMREARSAADASFVRANRAEMRAEKAERERDDAVAAHRSALAEQTARADTNFRAALKVQGDMTDLRVALSAAESANAEGHELLAAETARAEKAEGLLIQRETELRAQVARLTAALHGLVAADTARCDGDFCIPKKREAKT